MALEQNKIRKDFFFYYIMIIKASFFWVYTFYPSHQFLTVPLEIEIRIFKTFDNNFGIENDFTK